MADFEAMEAAFIWRSADEGTETWNNGGHCVKLGGRKKQLRQPGANISILLGTYIDNWRTAQRSNLKRFFESSSIEQWSAFSLEIWNNRNLESRFEASPNVYDYFYSLLNCLYSSPPSPPLSSHSNAIYQR